jgi:integrase
VQKERAYGPYRHGNRWRVVLRRGDGASRPRSFATLAAAERYIEEARGQTDSGITVRAAIEAYCKSLAERGLKFATYDRAEDHLNRLLNVDANGNRRVRWLQARGAELYEAAQRKSAVDSHRNALAAGKAFGAWAVKRGMLRRNPFELVEGQGRRRKGKRQLHVDESRKLMDACLALCVPDVRCEPVAVLTALLLGPRASEVVQRDVRDLDDGGRLLWIPDSKTEAGKRQLEIPEVLRQLLLELARDRIGAAPLFRDRKGNRPARWWLGYHCRRICKLAGVPDVTPQGLRGTHGSIARRGGATGELVAAQLGHASVTMQEGHYVTAEAAATGTSRAVAGKLIVGTPWEQRPVAGNRRSRK